MLLALAISGGIMVGAFTTLVILPETMFNKKALEKMAADTIAGFNFSMIMISLFVFVFTLVYMAVDSIW